MTSAAAERLLFEVVGVDLDDCVRVVLTPSVAAGGANLGIDNRDASALVDPERGATLKVELGAGRDRERCAKIGFFAHRVGALQGSLGDSGGCLGDVTIRGGCASR